MLLVTTFWLATAFIIPFAKSIGINTFFAQTATNVASAANGGIASASSELSSSSIAIDGVRNWATSGAWKDTTPESFPDWLQVDFSGSKTINEIVVYGVRDDYTNTADPTIDTVSSVYTLISFDVQYWTGSSWQTVPSGSITNNNKAVVKISFPAITTTKIRVVVNNAGASYSRIVELEAWSNGSTATPTPTPTSTPTPISTPTPNSTPTPTPTSTPAQTPTPSQRINVALTSNGGVASASSELSAASIAIDGVRNWATTGAWKDATADSFPDWLQVNFNGSKTINEIDVFAVRDDYTNAIDPTEETTFTLYGITDYNVQYWDGANWTTVPGGNIIANNKVWKKITFTPITTTSIRVFINNAQASYSRIVELEAWSGGTSTDIPTPSNDNTLIGSIDYVNSTPAGILCNFDELPLGAVYSFIICGQGNTQYAKFSSPSGYLRIYDEVGGGGYKRNYIQTTYPAYNFGNVIVEFFQPARNLSFSTVGANGGSFKVDIYQSNTYSHQININLGCYNHSICFTDLRNLNNVTAIVIHSINDRDGLGFDDFNFDVGNPTPTPTPPNRRPEGAFDDIFDGHARGWTRDPDDLNRANPVHFYLDKPLDQGGLHIGTVPEASICRTDVGCHGFNWRIPDQYRDGREHRLYVYGIDQTDPIYNNTFLPPTTGRPFTLGTPKVQSVTLESKINCTNLPNPTSGCLYENLGNGNPGTKVGLRIFPDRADPNVDDLNRRTIWVKAKVGVADTWVHFRNFDVDDPSYSSAPVDDDSGVKINDSDNRGAVGTSKAGLLSCPSGSIGICESEPNGVKAKTDANGIAIAEFRVTIQPGDNFVVAASTDKTYANDIKVAATDLQDNTGQFVPIAENVSSNAKRSEMLTIWRFVHLEIDSMGKVENNYLTVPIGADVTVGSSQVTVPILGFRRPLEFGRFESGKLVAGSSILEVDFNGDYDLHIHSAGDPVDIGYGQIFDLFDDDDYNRILLPGTFGDNGEEIEERTDTFSKMREFDTEAGNSFAKAYIRPEYGWAVNKGYNKGNLPFVSNVGSTILEDQIEKYRDSKNDEKDDFWVAYLQLAYQGGVLGDNDPGYEEATGGVTPDADTDDDPPPPPPPGLPPLFPSGGHGALIYMETCRDVDRDFDDSPYPSPYQTIWCVEVPVHELGHQFGLNGDTKDYPSGPNYFGVMGYSRTSYSFVERHINLLRSRVKSPGELGY